MNRPCLARNGGEDDQSEHGQPEDNNPPGNNTSANNNPPDFSNNHNSDGGPVNTSGASPYNFDNYRPSGDDHPNHGSYPLVAKDPDPFVPAPEPGYLGVTGLALVTVWMLWRKRRTA